MKRISTWLALRCKEVAFQQFLGVSDERTAVRAVRAMCDVQSRREIDTSKVAEHLFHQMIRLPYTNYLTDKETKDATF